MPPALLSSSPEPIPTNSQMWSMKKVSGRPLTPILVHSFRLVSLTLGKVMPNSSTKACTSAPESWTLTPRNWTPKSWYFCQLCSRIGASSLQGMHHEAQKLITTGLPRSCPGQHLAGAQGRQLELGGGSADQIAGSCSAQKAETQEPDKSRRHYNERQEPHRLKSA